MDLVYRPRYICTEWIFVGDNMSHKKNASKIFVYKFQTDITLPHQEGNPLSSGGRACWDDNRNDLYLFSYHVLFFYSSSKQISLPPWRDKIWNMGRSFTGNLIIWREILTFHIKEEIRKKRLEICGKFNHLLGKFTFFFQPFLSLGQIYHTFLSSSLLYVLFVTIFLFLFVYFTICTSIYLSICTFVTSHNKRCLMSIFDNYEIFQYIKEH